MKRRDFLSAAGFSLGALGLSQSGLAGLQAALAEPSRRRLALLIGINQYSDRTMADGRGLPLRGCLTDVELQRQLLIHRFGFQPKEISTLTNAQATRLGILSALYDLTQRARAGDTVLVHFSGYGGQAVWGERSVKTWVPVDSYSAQSGQNGVSDIPEAWIKQLLGRLKTKQVFTIVDAGHTDSGVLLSGGYRSRVRPGAPKLGALDLRDKDLLASAQEVFTQVSASQEPAFFPGDLLLAATSGQSVIERQWQDFGAGLFTYGLTQYLWASRLPAPLFVAMRGAQETLLPLLGEQVPYWTTQTTAEHIIYGETDLPSADAVVTALDGRLATLWLGGLPADVVQYSERFSFSATPDGDGPLIVLRSQSGLEGQLKLADNVDWSVGQPLYEAVRVLPKDIDLVVSLDPSMERIERVDATSALAALPYVSSTADSNYPADCLFGPSQVVPDASLPEDASIVRQGYGLFTSTGELILGSLAKQDEAIKMAVNRLTPKLKTMLAMKLLRLIENQASSQLAVRLNLLMVGENDQLVLQRETLRTAAKLSKSRLAAGRQTRSLTFAKSTQVCYEAFNFGSEPLYIMLLTFDARDRIVAFFPPGGDQPYSIESLQAALTLAPGTSMRLPVGQSAWVLDSSKGSVETYLVCGTRPLKTCWQELLSVANGASNQRVTLSDNSLSMVKSLLKDLSNCSDDSEAGNDSYGLNTATWATLGCHYSVAV